MSIKNNALEITKQRHEKYAPYWAAGLVIFGATGLATTRFDLGSFWSGYVLDMVGPAWNYILFRGLFTYHKDNAWTRFFTPVVTVSLFLIVCFSIELAQLLELYEATYDPWDFLAYTSILVPLFILDVIQNSNRKLENLRA
jgi:hypothetical protein